MKILFVLEYYHPHIGGVESLFKSLVDNLSDNEHSIIILTNRYNKALPELEIDGNVSIKRYTFFNRYLFTFLAWIPALFVAKGVDIIHTTSYNAALPAWVAAKIRNKKIIITFHEYWGDLWFELPWMSSVNRLLHSTFERLLVKLPFDKFVAVSDYTKQCLLKAGVGKSKIRRIYNGINYPEIPTHEPNNSNEKFTFTYFGRIGYSKGLDVLIEATSQLSGESNDFILQLIVPKEGLLDKIEKLIEQYKVASHITFKNELSDSDLKQTLINSDAIVIPSYSEGFCFAAVETMALGIPVISSGRAALKEVIGGKHIELEELSATQLYKAMERAMNGDWDYKKPIKFELASTVKNYMVLYEEMVDN